MAVVMGRVMLIGAGLALIAAAAVAAGTWVPRPAPAAAQAASGSLMVRTVDGDDAPVPGACYHIFVDDNGPTDYVGEACDGYDGDDDGETVFEDLPAGDYVLIQIAVAPGFTTGKDRQIAITAGEETTFTFRTPRGGRVATLTLVDDNDQPLPGACYQVYASGEGSDNPLGQLPGPAAHVGCDFYDGDDGVTTIAGIERGAYQIVLTFPPRGYTIPAGQLVEVGDDDLDLEFAVEPGGETLTIGLEDSAGAPVLGGCHAIFAAPAGSDGSGVEGSIGLGALAAVICDPRDGTKDGDTTVVGLVPGIYAVAPIPTAGTTAPPDAVPVEVVGGEDAELTITIREAPADATPST